MLLAAINEPCCFAVQVTWRRHLSVSVDDRLLAVVARQSRSFTNASATLQLHNTSLKSLEMDRFLYSWTYVVLALALVPRHGIHHIMTIVFQSDSDARGVRRRSDAAAAHIHSTSAENLPGTHSLGGV